MERNSSRSNQQGLIQEGLSSGAEPEPRAAVTHGSGSTAPQSRKETQMNWNQVEGNWEQFKGQVQSKWGKLTNDDLDVIAGKRKELAGRIQKSYGKTQEEAEREIDEWLTRH
jgi:uncharacterized protein YjbJ (UPF0337 family)